MTIGVGIDVSKAYLDVASTEETTVQRMDNTLAGWKALATQFKGQNVRIVLEASGGYEQGVLDHLSQAGLTIFRVNPRQARDFAKGLGQLAKTDQLDARMLAQMAVKVDTLVAYRPATAEQRQIAEWVHRRQQLVGTLQRERQRISTLDDKVLVRYAKQSLKSLQAQFKKINQTLRTLVRALALTQDLASMKGAGPVLLSVLTGLVSELGTLGGRQIAKLVGVAPLNDDSGQRRGRRRVWGGRAQVRAVLYMAALTAIRHEPAIRTMYQRLRGNGKLPKVAIVACMRKMLVILNARARDHYAQNAAPAAG